MTGQEMLARISEHQARRMMLHEEIVKSARSMVPVLKDHNLTNVAKELDEKLFLLDALEGELHTDMMKNPNAVMEMLRSLRP